MLTVQNASYVLTHRPVDKSESPERLDELPKAIQLGNSSDKIQT